MVNNKSPHATSYTLIVGSHLHSVLPARIMVLAHPWCIVCQENITVVYTMREERKASFEVLGQIRRKIPRTTIVTGHIGAERKERAGASNYLLP